jgi:hypothetical protein
VRNLFQVKNKKFTAPSNKIRIIAPPFLKIELKRSFNSNYAHGFAVSEARGKH